MALRPKVLLTRRLPQPGIELLERHVDLFINPLDVSMSRQDMITGIKDKDGLICLLNDKVDAEVIDAAKHLKIIANYAVGYNNIDVQAATKRKIPITNTPGVLTETTADLTFALILSAARRIVEADRYLREGKFKGWAPMLMLGNDVYNRTLGIIGFGRIGRAVAQRAKGFHMKIIYYEPVKLSHDIEKKYSAEYRSIDDLLKESDFVTIHTLLVESTHHLISEKEFSLMKKTAYIINTARGPIVDEKALVRVLKERMIAGCALDVFEKEPDVEKELVAMPNTVLTPHIGSASMETRSKMAMMVAENIITVLVEKGRAPNTINPQVYE
jgi:glyoxylate reductase